MKIRLCEALHGNPAGAVVDYPLDEAWVLVHEDRAEHVDQDAEAVAPRKHKRVTSSIDPTTNS